MDQTNEFIVPEELDDERFDAVIASLSEGHSRSYLKTLIKDGSVLLNGKEAKPSAKVHENDVICSCSLPASRFLSRSTSSADRARKKVLSTGK